MNWLLGWKIWKKSMKPWNSNNLKTIVDLKTKVASLEKQTEKKKFEFQKNQKADDLDMSFGQRYCRVQISTQTCKPGL